MQEKSKYCCEEHTDRAFDDFLSEYETFPCFQCSDISNKKCDYCESTAKYVLSFPS